MARRVMRSAQLRRATIASAVVVSATLWAGAGSGCDVITSVGPKSCDQTEKSNPVTLYKDGTVEGGIYMSSPWDKDWLSFPGGMQITFQHHLGTTPRTLNTWLAFGEEGVGGGGLVAASAGNPVLIRHVDDETITLKNGSCSDYYVMLTAQVSDEGPAPPAASAAQ